MEMFDSCIHVCTQIYIYIMLYIYMYLCVYRQVCILIQSIYSNSRFMCSLSRSDCLDDPEKKCPPNVVDKNWIVMLLKPRIYIYLEPQVGNPLKYTFVYRHVFLFFFISPLLGKPL